MNIQEIMRQAQKMQKEMENIQQNAGKEIIEVSSGGGMVKVKMTGLCELVSIEIDKEIVDPDDVEMLQDLITAAVNEAYKKAKSFLESRMGGVAGGLGLNLPGF